VPSNDLPLVVDQDGMQNPNLSMLAAIWRICFFECVLAFFS